MERDAAGGTAKIHYVGYSSHYDKWQSVSELVDRIEEADKHELHASSSFLHQELAYRIKSSLSSSRKSSPEVRIDVPFDKDVFDKGLKAKAREIDRAVKGNKQYTISSYDDLDDLLGKNWHVRGLNPAGDFCYPILDTIRFFPLVEYTPSQGEGGNRKVGFILVFLFVRDDGLSHNLKSMYSATQQESRFEYGVLSAAYNS